MAAAAREQDPIAHTHAMAGLLVGLAVGALAGAAILATGGLGLVALAGAAAMLAAGGGIGQVIGSMNIIDSMFGRNTTGLIETGSRDVIVNGKGAARAHGDIAACRDHAPLPSLLAQGSASVFVNGMPMARVGDLLTCGAKIADGSANVFVGGATETTDLIEPEIPDWVNDVLLGVGLGAAVVIGGVGFALLGLACAYGGGKLGEYFGEQWYGKGSDGQKWMMLGGSVVGGILGAKGGSVLSGRLSPHPTSSIRAFLKGGAPELGEFKASMPAAIERPGVGKTLVGEPVDVVTGDVILYQNDFALSGALSIVLQRVHTSGNPNGTLFGPAWASTWGQWIEVVDEQEVIFHNDDGASMRFAVPQPGESTSHRVYRTVRLTRLADGYRIEQRHRPALHLTERHGRHWRLAAIVDRNGNRIALTYDGRSLAEVRHSGGARLKVDTGEHGITRIALWQPDGTQTDLVNYRYGPDGNLCALINSSGRPLTYAYDQAHRLVRWQDRNDRWFSYRYDHQGRCMQTEGGDGYLNGTLEYDEQQRINVYTDALGHATAYRYDAAFQVIGETDARGGVSSYRFDACGNKTMAVLPNGAVLRWEYDARSNLTSFTDALDQETVLAYNDLDLPIAIVTPDGNSVRRVYDEKGNLTAIGRDAAWTTFDHDDCGNVVRVVNPGGAAAHFSYDTQGLLTRATDWLGNPTRFARDAFGRVVARTDAQRNTSCYRYSVEGKLLETVLPDGSRHSAQYDAEGNCTVQTDALGHVTRFEYGAFDVLTGITRANGARTAYQYDAELRLSAVINPQGQCWRYRYNGTGQVTEETDFGGRQLQYGVDACGFVTEKRSPSGRITRYRRDRAGRLVEQVDGDGSTRFSYDAMGRLRCAVNPDAEIRFERDGEGRIVREWQNGAEVGSSYDIQGRRIRRSSGGEQAGGHVCAWEFDANGLPLALSLPDAQTLHFVHDSLGRETARSLPGGGRVEQTFDRLSRLTRQWTGIAAAPGKQARTLQDRSIDYDANGNPCRLGTLNGRMTDIRYDAIGQVTQVARGTIEERYAYDLANNLIDAVKRTSLLASDASNAGVLGPRIYQHGRLRQAGKVKYEYDAEGRTVARIEGKRWGRQQVWRYVWNSEDRLKKVVTPTGDVWEYRYDALGRRLAKTQTVSSANRILTDIGYLWDGHTVVTERKTRTKPGRNGAPADIVDEVTCAWDYEPGSFRPLAKTETVRNKRRETRRSYAVITDHLGTPKELVGADGMLAWQATTNLWGEVEKVTVSKTDCPIRYQGQYYDEESKLAYNWQRYYDASTGRYLTPDPLGLAGGMSPYGYVGNPLKDIDPLGLMATCGAGASSGDGKTVPPVPDKIIGDQSDPRAGPNKGGGKHTSGPLTPENGGTGDFDADLNILTGGTRPRQPGDKAPPGSLVGPNGIFGRPENSTGGKSIDIPRNGNKPHETLHYP